MSLRDARDGLTRLERIILWQLHEAQRDLGRDSVPTALLYGRVTYEMMQEAWRPIAESGTVPEGMADWVLPFARSIHAARKYVASTTMRRVDWNARLIEGELQQAIEQIKPCAI